VICFFIPLLSLPAVIVSAGTSPIINLGNLLTDSTARAFSVDAGVITWQGLVDEDDAEIFCYNVSSGDTTQIRQITDNDFSDNIPQVDSGIIVWEGRTAASSDVEIFCYNVSSGDTTQLTNNTYNDLSPQVDSGIIVWEAWGSSTDEIYYYDVSWGNTAQPKSITNNSYYDILPQVDAGVITWYGSDGSDYEIYYYDVSSDGPLQQVTNNSYDDFDPQVDAGVITWQGHVAGLYQEIFFYNTSWGDTTQPQRITNNSYTDSRPQVDAGVITWQGLVDEDDAEIFCYNVSSGDTTQITDNGWTDRYPQIDSTIVTWEAYRADGDWIFFAYLDVIPPVTTSSIVGTHTSPDNQWYISNVTINLTAIDVEAGVGKIYYSLNSGATWIVVDDYTTSVNISTEGSNTIYFYSSDNALPPNNETVTIQTILIDTILPIITPTSSWINGSELKASNYEMSWTATDSGSGIDHYEARVDSETWANIADLTTYKFQGFSDGSHIFAIKAVDKAGNSKILSRNVIINTSPIGGPGLLEETFLGVACASVAVGAFLFMKRKKPKTPSAPTPERLRIKAESPEIPSDGKSTITITIELLDENEKLIPTPKDIEVTLSTTLGKINTPVIIQKGQAVGKSLLTSSTEFGEATVSAASKGLKQASVSLKFVEAKRYCMHCGTRMSREINLCPKCGRAPPSGVDVKACTACGEIIPAVAKFCNNCGARQF
jgi:RNA polymerase subunit RPABC4/transcription elongation factor Spt4